MAAMMMKLLCACALVLAAACGGEDPEVSEGAFGATCATVTDTDSTECDSGVCTDAFDMLGHPVCSQKCTPGDGSTCPEGSEGKKCNMKGYCKP
jgi:hypothetical protein